MYHDMSNDMSHDVSYDVQQAAHYATTGRRETLGHQAALNCQPGNLTAALRVRVNNKS